MAAMVSRGPGVTCHSLATTLAMHAEDTIAAIATPLGEGGIAVIRLSGSSAIAIADRCFEPAGRNAPRLSVAPSHTLHYGHIVRDAQTVDEVLAAVMRAPRTFTREDVVEISCHGGLLPARAVLDAVLAAGARVAEPGEFSKRAFLNGRIDLAQAEAIADLIHSRTELALRAANEQLAGRLSHRVEALREQMLSCLAHVEAQIDFPEEDIAPDTKGQLIERLNTGIAFLGELLATAHEGQLLRRGIRVGIVGRPNVGKSSLLNALLGHDRAIVSAVPGTTRDTIEETADIRGLPVVFIDTAGLRDARDEIELEGIRRTRKTLEAAELLLYVIDGSGALQESEQRLLEATADRKRLVVLNKADLPVRAELTGFLATEAVSVSCVSGAGLEDLKDRIKETVWAGKVEASMLQVMINSRHQEALSRARAAAVRCVEAFQQDATLELVAADLRIAVNAIGEIVGHTTTEDLLDRIFGQFCIGK